MAKSSPIGIRFDLDFLRAIKEDGFADTPQKAVNIFSERYLLERSKSKNVVVKLPSPESFDCEKIDLKNIDESFQYKEWVPKSIEEIKAACPIESGIDRTMWISKFRKMYNL